MNASTCRRLDLRGAPEQGGDAHPGDDGRSLIGARILGDIHALALLERGLVFNEFPPPSLLFQHVTHGSRQSGLIRVMQQMQEGLLRPGLPLRHARVIGEERANRRHAQGVALRDIAVAGLGPVTRQEIGGLL